MEYMRLWNMSLTTDIVRVMAKVEKVQLGFGVKTDWRMVMETLNNFRKEPTVRLQEVMVDGRANWPPYSIKTELENSGVLCLVGVR